MNTMSAKSPRNSSFFIEANEVRPTVVEGTEGLYHGRQKPSKNFCGERTRRLAPRDRWHACRDKEQNEYKCDHDTCHDSDHSQHHCAGAIGRRGSRQADLKNLKALKDEVNAQQNAD